VALPDAYWIDYYLEDLQTRLVQLPITNWWHVRHGERTIKQGLVVPASIFFELLNVVCARSRMTTAEFRATLHSNLLDAFRVGATASICDAWTKGHMLSPPKRMHTTMAAVYRNVHAAVESQHFTSSVSEIRQLYTAPKDVIAPRTDNALLTDILKNLIELNNKL
jgi:hypothetical protein